MKNFLIIFIAFFCSLSSFAQNNTKKTRAQIYFTKTLHTFDTIPLGKSDTCIFQYKNTGLAPLIVSEVKASCGCTSPIWSSKPLLSGRWGNIKIVYYGHQKGHFRKTIVVRSNAENAPNTILQIQGFIIDRDPFPKKGTKYK